MVQHRSTPQRPDTLRKSTYEDYLQRMTRLQQHLLTHQTEEDLDPDQLARVACMSKAHFHRVFRAMFGESVMEHLRRTRLEQAAKRLRFQPQVRILDIALDSGYGSHEAFTRAFQTHFGLAPAEFRRSPSVRLQEAQGPQRPHCDAEVKIKTVAAQPFVCLRHWGEYISVGQSFVEAVEQGYANNLIPESLQLLGMYHDDPEITAPDKLRSDVGFAVEEAGALGGELTYTIIPGGVYATLVHRGPYETLSQTYLQLIGRWLPGSGYELCAQGVVEVYLNSPQEVAPEDLLTEVRVRLQTQGSALH